MCVCVCLRFQKSKINLQSTISAIFTLFATKSELIVCRVRMYVMVISKPADNNSILRRRPMLARPNREEQLGSFCGISTARKSHVLSEIKRKIQQGEYIYQYIGMYFCVCMRTLNIIKSKHCFQSAVCPS